MRFILPVVVLGALAVCSSAAATADPPKAKVQTTSAGVICPSPFVVCTEDEATCCSSSDGGFTQDNNITLMHTQPIGCPPAQLYAEPLGSIVCKTECCSSDGVGAKGRGRCNLAGNKLAITPVGWRTTLPPFDTGITADNNNWVMCYMRTAPSCVFSEDPPPTGDTSGSKSCGLKLSLAVTKLNENGPVHPIVKALNESLSSIISWSVVEKDVENDGDYRGRRISAKFDQDKARALVESKRTMFNEYCDTVAPTEAELKAMSTEDKKDEAKELEACKDKAKKEGENFIKGKKFSVTWGFAITAWGYVTEDDTFSADISKCSVDLCTTQCNKQCTPGDFYLECMTGCNTRCKKPCKDKDGVHVPQYKSRTFISGNTKDQQNSVCFKVNQLPAVKDFMYKEAPLMFNSCLQKCKCPKLPKIEGCIQKDGYPCAASALSTSTMLAMVATLCTLALSW